MIYNFEKLTFQVLLTDKFKHSAGVFDVKERPFASLSLRLSGNGIFKTKNAEFVSNPGDITFLPSNTDYHVEYSGGECIAVHLTDCNYGFTENMETENNEIIYGLFDRLLKIKNIIGRANEKKSVVYQILQELSENSHNYLNSDDIQKCIYYINTFFSNPQIGIDDICKYAGISESTLRRRFHEYFGISPKQYLINLRINKAIRLLNNKNKSIKEISDECGFNDEKYFSSTVKKHFRISPSELRKKLGGL